MGYSVDILEPVTGDINASMSKFAQAIVPLYAKHWDKHMAEGHPGRVFDLNAQALINGWMSRLFKIIVLTDTETKKLEGFLIGMRYRPMCYDAEVFTITDWYGNGCDAEKALFDYAVTVMKILGSTEMIVPEELNQVPPADSWKQVRRDTVVRYERV